jgi:16S rRNA (guanine966-N2)-methyltransferase
MTRIVAGRLGGRRLAAPTGRDTRPTSDRVREALFSAVEASMALSGARVLDLYAGSGALGLEAASRGAGEVLLVEADAQAARAARHNIAALELSGTVALAATSVDRLLVRGPDGAGYDLVLADPPYALNEDALQAVLAALVKHGWLAPGALVVIERSSRSPEPTWVPGLSGKRSPRYGQTTLWYGAAS